MRAELLRKSLKLAIASFITAAIAVFFQRIEFVWYPLLAVVVVVDDNDEQTIAAARSRILGTVVGGLVTFLVHTILAGWIGVLVSILLMVPVLRILGWQSGLSTAALVSVMFLMIPGHAELNWNYVFNRALDTSVGCAVALAVGLLLWPRDRLRLLCSGDAELRQRLQTQLRAYRAWLAGQASRPEPLPIAALGARLDAMQRWIELERSGPHGTTIRRQRWRQRLLLWRLVVNHWLQWERLLVDVQPVPLLETSLDPLISQLQPAGTPPLQQLQAQVTGPWQRAAAAARRPLPYLAVKAELAPLLAAVRSLALLPPLPREVGS
ncbi:MAG: FUSC family protein [Cyanobacteriota bacterium]|nr:FUSC family protein [Cyanobacteriota bacterium]